jgi:hypothetical protein
VSVVVERLDASQDDPVRVAAGVRDDLAEPRQQTLVRRTAVEVENLDRHG